jgi:hypothetical protein
MDREALTIGIRQAHERTLSLKEGVRRTARHCTTGFSGHKYVRLLYKRGVPTSHVAKQ